MYPSRPPGSSDLSTTGHGRSARSRVRERSAGCTPATAPSPFAPDRNGPSIVRGPAETFWSPPRSISNGRPCGTARKTPKKRLTGPANRPISTAPQAVTGQPGQTERSSGPDAATASLGDSLTVEQRTLTPLVVVRIHVPQPPYAPGIERSIFNWLGRRLDNPARTVGHSPRASCAAQPAWSPTPAQLRPEVGFPQVMRRHVLGLLAEHVGDRARVEIEPARLRRPGVAQTVEGEAVRHLSRFALAGQRFARSGSCLVADFCRRTSVRLGDICVARVIRCPDRPEERAVKAVLFPGLPTAVDRQPRGAGWRAQRGPPPDRAGIRFNVPAARRYPSRPAASASPRP